jgi:hypothetical protein
MAAAVPDSLLPYSSLEEPLAQFWRWREQKERKDEHNGGEDRPPNVSCCEIGSTAVRPRAAGTNGLVVCALQDGTRGGFLLWDPSVAVDAKDGNNDEDGQARGGEDEGVVEAVTSVPGLNVHVVGFSCTGMCFLESPDHPEEGGTVFCVANEQHCVMAYELSADRSTRVAERCVVGKWKTHGEKGGDPELLYYPQDCQIFTDGESGRYVIAVSDGATDRIACFDAETGRFLRQTPKGIVAWPTSFAIDENGQNLMVPSGQGKGEITVLSLDDCVEKYKLPDFEAGYSFAFDGENLLCLRADGLHIQHLPPPSSEGGARFDSEASMVVQGTTPNDPGSGHLGVAADPVTRRVTLCFSNRLLVSVTFGGLVTKSARKRS